MKTENIIELCHIDIMSGTPLSYTVGKNCVTAIIEKPAYGEGDKWYYDIEFENKTVLRVFNPDTIRYNK